MSPSTVPSTTFADESTPLLVDVEPEEKEPNTPLAGQLAVLCFLRLLDPLNFTQIFPYINQFLADLHASQDASRIGLYSGLVESAFAFAQLLAIYPWASLSDRVGRKPIILTGVIGLACATLTFGLSPNFASMLISRALAGIFSGNVPLVPTVLCEITNTSNQAFAFSLFSVWWPVGAIIGPLVGGSFSNPKILPSSFRYQVFEDHPYFLPGLIVALVNFFGAILTASVLKETVQFEPKGTVNRKPSFSVTTKTLLSIPIFRSLCASACSLSFITVAFEVVFVLFCYSPVTEGGLALSVQEIGFSLAFSGFAAAFSQVLIMPVLLRRFDNTKLYLACVSLWPFVFLALPGLNILARHGLDEGTGKLSPIYMGMIWTGIAAILAVARLGFWPYSINMLLVKRYSPASVLGSANGLLQFFICLSRAFGPITASSIFALSVERNLIFGYLWAIFLSAMALVGTLLARNIVKQSSRVQ